MSAMSSLNDRETSPKKKKKFAENLKTGPNPDNCLVAYLPQEYRVNLPGCKWINYKYYEIKT
jgi:hypothetical protein